MGFSFPFPFPEIYNVTTGLYGLCPQLFQQKHISPALEKIPSTIFFTFKQKFVKWVVNPTHPLQSSVPRGNYNTYHIIMVCLMVVCQIIYFSGMWALQYYFLFKKIIE